MPLPRIAIVGRPNVGKSSLFNRLARQRLAVVDAKPGTTRDRMMAAIEREGRWMELIDTGGLGVVDKDGLTPAIEAQVGRALDEATVAVLVVDVRSGPHPLDREFARRLRGGKLPVIVAANKADTPALDHEAAPFHTLGLGDPIPLSANEGRGMEELLEALAPHLGDSPGPPPPPAFRVAIVGPRNAGKSTFVNSLAGEERVIVSPVPGTTRDAIDVVIEKDGREIVIVDTAGFRRRGPISGTVEHWTQGRAEDAIPRADVALLMLDVTKPVGKVEKQLADLIVRFHRPCIVVANKYDLAKDKVETGEFGDYFRRTLPMLAFAPIAFTTATTGQNASAVLDLAANLVKQADRRVPTAELNRVLSQAIDRNGTPRPGGREGRMYYCTQDDVRPPTLVLFVNLVECFTGDYLRYLGNHLRLHGYFPEIPIRFLLRARRRAAPPGKPRLRTLPRKVGAKGAKR